MTRAFALAICLALAACGAGLPSDLNDRITPASQSAAPPQLVPLGPLLRETEALLPRSAVNEGRSLEARAADLRRRAALLRRLSI